MNHLYSYQPLPQKNNSALKQSVTLNINSPLNNPKFYELMTAYTQAPSEDLENELGVYLNTIHYLIGLLPPIDQTHTDLPSTLTVSSGDNLEFLICTTQEREIYLPVFTDSKEVPLFSKEMIYTLSVPAKWLWNFVLSQKNYQGIIFNPGSLRWPITLEHIASLLDDIK